jgi:hypothetical protein
VSELLGGASFDGSILDPDDRRAMGEHFRQINVEFTWFGEVGDQRSPWWPGGGTLSFGDASVDFAMMGGVWYALPDTSRGSMGRWGVSGVTRDVYGSPLGGVTVKLYQTSSDLMVSSVVSDPLGNYFVTTPFYPDAHYLVFYKAGSPDVFGTTPNTLIAG